MAHIKTPTNVAIYGYKMASNAVRSLQKELGVLQILHEGSHYKGSPDKAVINYGASYIPANIMKSFIVNKPSSVALCIDKLKFFTHLYEIEAPVEIPDWTSDPGVAKKWINDENIVLLARTIVNGRSGQGIKILKKGVDFINAPLYTRYIPKEYEFRVHVLDGNVIDVQRKILQKDAQLTDEEKKIRSHDNGWVFTRNPELLKVPNVGIEELAKTTIQCMDLQFGAVDIIYSKKQNKAFVLEVNSAPGLEGASVMIYAEAFRKWLGIGEVKR